MCSFCRKNHVRKIPRFRGGGGYFGFWGGGGVPILFLWARGFFWNWGRAGGDWLQRRIARDLGALSCVAWSIAAGTSAWPAGAVMPTQQWSMHTRGTSPNIDSGEHNYCSMQVQRDSSTVRKLGALQRQVDLQGVSCKNRWFYIRSKRFSCGILREQALLRKSKTPRKSPEKWTFLSLAFYNAHWEKEARNGPNLYCVVPRLFGLPQNCGTSQECGMGMGQFLSFPRTLAPITLHQ